ncbi:BDM_1a_G0025980.mRNA.1.CDS.1 [Saccharomyces cerevisiae]|nr:BDM_1a_G0025980.mRNA.1.CDS.1 [Saccharomyces cerevisiae]CAI7088924.1 BDM_1a_G0025980.mRNA.1.CDS.1 [Saccharomyces cerevisiae]
MSGRQIKELYYKVWSNLRIEDRGAAVLFELGRKSAREEWEAKDDTVFVEAVEKVGVFQRLRSMTSAGLQGPQYVKLQFSRHHRQLRSRYELSLGMHLRDQIALELPHLKCRIGRHSVDADRAVHNKTFRQKLEYLLEQISEVWLLPHWLDLANVEVLAAADNTKVPLYMLMVAVHKELIAMMFQTVDLIYYYVGIRAEKLESDGNCCYESQ